MPVHQNDSTDQYRKLQHQKPVSKDTHQKNHSGNSHSTTQLHLDYDRHEINVATDTDSLNKNNRNGSSRPKSKPSHSNIRRSSPPKPKPSNSNIRRSSSPKPKQSNSNIRRSNSPKPKPSNSSNSRSSPPKSKPSNTSKKGNSAKAQQYTFLTPEYQRRHLDDVPGEHHDVVTQMSKKRPVSGKSKKGKDTGKVKSVSSTRKPEPRRDNLRHASYKEAAPPPKQRTTSTPPPQPPRVFSPDRHPAPVDNTSSPKRTPEERSRHVRDDRTPHARDLARSPGRHPGFAPPYVLIDPSKDRHSSHSGGAGAHAEKQRHKLKSKSSSTRSRSHFWNRKKTGHAKTGREVSSPPKESTPIPRVPSTQSFLTCESAPVKAQQQPVSPVRHVDLSHTRCGPVQNKPPPKVHQPCPDRQRPCTAPPPQCKPDKSPPPIYMESHLRPRGVSPTPFTVIDTRLQSVTSKITATSSREVPKFPAYKDFDWSRSYTCSGSNKASVPQSTRSQCDDKRFELRQSRLNVSVPPKRHYDKYHSKAERPRSVSSETIRHQPEASPQRGYNYQGLTTGPRDKHETSPPVSMKRTTRKHTCQVSKRSSSGSSIPRRDTSTIRSSSSYRTAHQISHDKADRKMEERKVTSRSSGTSIPQRDTSMNRVASHYRTAHQKSHDNADRKMEERKDTSRSPKKHFSSESHVISSSSVSSVVDTKRGRTCSSISRTSLRSGSYKAQSSRSSDRDKREGSRSPMRYSPVGTKSSHLSLNKSGRRYNVNGSTSSQSDRYDFNGSNNKTPVYRKSTAEPPAKICVRSKYQVKKTRSKISYKISHQTFPESNGQFSPLANSTSIASSSATYSTDNPHNIPPNCNCCDEGVSSPAKPQLQSMSSVFSDPSNVSSIDRSNSSSAAMKGPASHRAQRPSLHTYHKMSHARAAQTKPRQNVSYKSKSKTDPNQSRKRCGDLKSCRELFPDHKSSNRSLQEYNSESEGPDSQNISLVLCPPDVETTGCKCEDDEDGDEDEDSSTLLDQVLNLVCRSHRLQELIKYQLDKIDAIDAAVAARADDMRRRPRDAALHPELYAVAKNTLKVKVQLLRELCEIKRDVTKLKNTMSKLSKEDLTNFENFNDYEELDESGNFSGSSIHVKTVHTSWPYGRTKKKTGKLNSSEVLTINKTVTFNRNVKCRCPMGQLMSAGRGREGGEDAGDVAVLKDIMGEVSSHVREFQSFVNHIDPSLNDIVSNVKAMSHTFVKGSEGQSSCDCDTGDLEQRRTTSPGPKRSSSPQKMYSRSAAQGDKDIVSYWARGQDKTERVWDKITSCVDAILKEGGVPFEPEATRHAEENESNAIMDDVYRMIEEMDSEISCCDADCTNKPQDEDDDGEDCDCDETREFTNPENVSNRRPEKYSISNRNATGSYRNELEARRVPAPRVRTVSRPQKPSTLDERANSLMSFAEELAASAQSISQCACSGDMSAASTTAGNSTQPTRLKPPSEQDNMDTLYQLAARKQSTNKTEEKISSKIKIKSKRSITLKVLVPRRSANKSGSAVPQKNRDGDLHSSPGQSATRDHEFISCDSLIVKSSEETSKLSNKFDDFCSCQSEETSQSHTKTVDFSSAVNMREQDNITARYTAVTCPGEGLGTRGQPVNSTARQRAISSPRERISPRGQPINSTARQRAMSSPRERIATRGQPISSGQLISSTARQRAMSSPTERISTRGQHVVQDKTPDDTCACSETSDTIVQSEDDWGKNVVARSNNIEARKTTPPTTNHVDRRNDVNVRKTTPTTNNVDRENKVIVRHTTPPTTNHVDRRNDVHARKTTPPTTEVYILRRIEPDCLLVEWTVPPKDCYSGFDVFVDEMLAQRVRSPHRFQAILHGLDLNHDHVVTMVALCVQGGGNEHCTTQARVTYKGGQRPYRCTRYGGSSTAS